MAVFGNRVAQPVRVHTATAVIDGLLTLALGQRTLDELNLDARQMLILEEPVLRSGSMPIDEGPIGIQKSAILMALEIAAPNAPLAPARGDEGAMHAATRALVRLHLPCGFAEGYVIAIPGVDPLARLHQAGKRFIATLSTHLEGPGMDGSAPFVAVNMSHVLAAQVLLAIEAAPEEGAGEIAVAG